ncbi:MAG TPA: hypothetical protein P5186_02160 [Candidatus Paceibacterota bacterium]|nr:hypothetical protein [Verrucomicrobiota bacterium]HRY46826.1 hypothetical protein [Candidatus Paceibacterota bacterium]
MIFTYAHKPTQSPVARPAGSRGNSAGRILVVVALSMIAAGILSRPFVVVAQETNRTSRTDLTSFKIIEDRNIFNANRSARQNRSNSRERKEVKIDAFKLVGSMTHDDGAHAFFDGSSPAYRKAIKANEKIAGFKVFGITLNSVQLENGDQKIELRMGAEMRREEEGEWKLISASDSTSTFNPGSSSSPSGASESSSSGESSDILKRLMQQREQELK